MGMGMGEKVGVEVGVDRGGVRSGSEGGKLDRGSGDNGTAKRGLVHLHLETLGYPSHDAPVTSALEGWRVSVYTRHNANCVRVWADRNGSGNGQVLRSTNPRCAL